VRRFPHFLFFLIVLVTRVAVCQSPNGTISGLVLDPSGRAIVGAAIQIVNDATGVGHGVETNGEGIYAIPNLPPGSYRIQVSKIGFKTLIKPDITLNVQDALAINFTLPIGALSETVTVQGGAPLVNTESASVSTVIDRDFVENLPLNGRSFNTLLQLTPGSLLPLRTILRGSSVWPAREPTPTTLLSMGFPLILGLLRVKERQHPAPVGRRPSAPLEGPAVWSRLKRFRNFASRHLRFRPSLERPRGDRSFSQLAPELTRCTAPYTNISVIRSWMPTIGLRMLRVILEHARNITILADSLGAQSGSEGRFSFSHTKAHACVFPKPL
jgi:hypothetical protein